MTDACLALFYNNVGAPYLAVQSITGLLSGQPSGLPYAWEQLAPLPAPNVATTKLGQIQALQAQIAAVQSQGGNASALQACLSTVLASAVP